jgi:hypothetical protein
MPSTGEQLKPYHFQKGAPSANPNGRPRKEVSVRTWLKEMGEQRARGLGDRTRQLLVKSFGYKDNWTNERVLAGIIWARAAQGDKEFVKYAVEYTCGRPVSMNDMPQVIVNQQTVVQQNEPTNYEQVVTAFKAMVSAGIVPAEMFQQYATRGNGHLIEDGDE